MRYDVEVREQDGRVGLRTKRYAVYGITIAEDGTRTEELLEGGFFERWNAEACAREYLGDIAERAERAAGWDQNP
jgi:hypothetical protein